MSVIVPPSPCPRCGAINDAVSTLGGDAHPRPGDVSVCFYCAGVLRFADDLSLRAPDGDELRELLEHQEVVDMVVGIREWIDAGRPRR